MTLVANIDVERVKGVVIIVKILDHCEAKVRGVETDPLHDLAMVLIDRAERAC